MKHVIKPLMRTLWAALCLAWVTACSAQTVTMRQVTNYALPRINPVMGGGTLGFSNSSLYISVPSDLEFYLTDGTNNYIFKTSIASFFGDSSGTLYSALVGKSAELIAGTGGIRLTSANTTNMGNLYVEGIAYDQNNRTYVTTINSSNDVQVVAGSGTIVTASGAGGVMTYTVTSTAGAGATNAISAVQTNSAIGGIGLTSIGFNDGYGNTVAGVSNNGAFTLTWKVDFLPATNYANLVFISASNLALTIGANATSLVYAVGANDTNFALAIGAAGTNLANSYSTALTNLANAKQDGFTALTELGNSGIRFPSTASMIESNVNQIFWNLQRMTVATNSSASNLVINLRTNKYYFTATNNITVTNLVGIAEGISSDTTIIIEPQLIPRAITYPTMGGASFGIYANTNDNAQMWTTLTNGSKYALTISAFGTNTFWSISRWK